VKTWPGAARCTAHHNLHLQNLRILLLEDIGDLVEVAIVDPRLQECRRNGKPHDALGNGLQLQPAKPAGKNIRTDLGLQTRTDPLEKCALHHVALFPGRPVRLFCRNLACILPILKHDRRRHRITKHIAAFQYYSATPTLLPASAFMSVSCGPFQRHAAQFKRSPYRKGNPHPPLVVRFRAKSIWRSQTNVPLAQFIPVSGQASCPFRVRPFPTGRPDPR
jgi:hypothetical protein